MVALPRSPSSSTCVQHVDRTLVGRNQAPLGATGLQLQKQRVLVPCLFPGCDSGKAKTVESCTHQIELFVGHALLGVDELLKRNLERAQEPVRLVLVPVEHLRPESPASRRRGICGTRTTSASDCEMGGMGGGAFDRSIDRSSERGRERG